MVDPERFEDWVLANAPEFVAKMEEADTEIARGHRGVPLEVALVEIVDDAPD